MWTYHLACGHIACPLDFLEHLLMLHILSEARFPLFVGPGGEGHHRPGRAEGVHTGAGFSRDVHSLLLRTAMH